MRDECLQLSDYSREWIDGQRAAGAAGGGREQRQPFVDRGAIVDDVVNRVLVRPVYETPHCQLVMCVDCCESGSLADLPFCLAPSGQWWVTSGQVRRDETVSGVRPMEWDCGQGVVIAFSAAEDLKGASDDEGGFLTFAILASGMGRPPTAGAPLTIGSVFREISADVRRRVQVARRRHPRLTQVPVLSCSHFASLGSPLHF
jgi:hypothetical protein